MIQNPFRSFKSNLYLSYWIFNTFSLLGTWVDFTLRQWMIVEMIKNEKIALQYVGVYNLAKFIPSAFLSFLAGYLSDRFNSRTILVLIMMIDFLNACIISYLVFTNNLNVLNFLVLAVFSGITSSLYFPTRSKFINMLAENKGDIPSFFSLQGVSFNLSRIIAPLIAGYLSRNFGFVWGFVFNAISFIPIIVYLITIKDNHLKYPRNRGLSTETENQNNLLNNLRRTIEYINSNGKIKKCFYGTFTVNFWGVSLVSFLQVFTKEILGANINFFSILMSVLGLGAVIGAFLVASTSYQVILNFREEFLILTYGLLIFLLSIFPNFCLAIIFFIGVLQALIFGFINNKLHLLTDSVILGKVMGIYSMFNISLYYFGAFCLSYIGYFLGILNLFKIVSIFIILSAILIGINVKEGKV
ncbi:MAG: MFS transporter [Candidatus Calescibacterium sp.]|nr:MFS transporter [Candidatus Calescibacterium sp.]MCX7972699.1 MFS transporter [bacterium]MDW8195503.1 MFS transporter [Candidatus Calescibacterium sp.]